MRDLPKGRVLLTLTHWHSISPDRGTSVTPHPLCPGLKGLRHSGKPGLFESVFHCVLPRRHSQGEPPAWSSLLPGPEVGQGEGNSAHPLLRFAS